eukprot:Filipodium_phascolosomae@DN2194_c0_g1_i2.p1
MAQLMNEAPWMVDQAVKKYSGHACVHLLVRIRALDFTTDTFGTNYSARNFEPRSRGQNFFRIPPLSRMSSTKGTASGVVPVIVFRQNGAQHRKPEISGTSAVLSELPTSEYSPLSFIVSSVNLNQLSQCIFVRKRDHDNSIMASLSECRTGRKLARKLIAFPSQQLAGMITATKAAPLPDQDCEKMAVCDEDAAASANSTVPPPVAAQSAIKLNLESLQHLMQAQNSNR